MRSGSAASNVTSNWVHFQSMQFMSNKANRRSSGNMDFLINSNKDKDPITSTHTLPKAPTTKNTPCPVSNTPKKSVRIPHSLNEADALYLSSLWPYITSIKGEKMKLQFRKEACDMILDFFNEIEERSSKEEPQVESDDGNLFSLLFIHQ